MSNISRRQLGEDIVLIEAPKTLDNSNAHEMINMITCAQAAKDKFIIIDMAHLEFISSAGVGSILGTLEASREVGGDIILCNITPNVLHVLKVLDLMDYFTIKSSIREAEVASGVG